jgi:hypothetical protein
MGMCSVIGSASNDGVPSLVQCNIQGKLGVILTWTPPLIPLLDDPMDKVERGRHDSHCRRRLLFFILLFHFCLLDLLLILATRCALDG